MSEMVERVARALYEMDHEAAPKFEGAAQYYRWDGPNFKGQDYFRRMARTAIEAMREPTEEMEFAFAQQGYTRTNFKLQFKAAIDAALSRT